MLKHKPLSDKIRPKILSEFVGQEHLVGKNAPIKKAVKNERLYSMLFWGPPGVGKTTLARVLAKELGYSFSEISPTTSGVKDIKSVVEKSKSFLTNGSTILFVDEIHRFNKAQQDYLLPHVESGVIILIGATTENPSFEIVPALLSRVQTYIFNPLSEIEVSMVIDRAIKYINKGPKKIKLGQGSRDFLIQNCNGDARFVLNTLNACLVTNNFSPTVKDLQTILQSSYLHYDKKGEEHYNTISAFIKSMRASKTNAALYYLARMVGSGEDPKFIARRMVIFASEDIGLANQKALQVANNVFKACEIIGYPECAINLAHGTAYLSESKKSRDSYVAYFKALEDVKKYGNLPIPLNLRNAPTKFMKDLGYGKGYKMYGKDEDYLPKKLKGKEYF